MNFNCQWPASGCLQLLVLTTTAVTTSASVAVTQAPTINGSLTVHWQLSATDRASYWHSDSK